MADTRDDVRPATDEAIQLWRGLLFNEMTSRDGHMLRPDELRSLLARLDTERQRADPLMAQLRMVTDERDEMLDCLHSGRMWSVMRERIGGLQESLIAAQNANSHTEESILFDGIAKELDAAIRKEITCRLSEKSQVEALPQPARAAARAALAGEGKTGGGENVQ